jgi:hypothetical protein
MHSGAARLAVVAVAGLALLAAVGLVNAAPMSPASATVPALNGSFTATGFFHVAQASDGRWWFVDPNGQPFYSAGIDHVSASPDVDVTTGQCPYCQAIASEYPTTTAWANATVDRLRSWGFNTIGPFSDSSTFAPLMPYTVQLTMASGADWFAPSFVTHTDQVAATQVAPLANDPNLIGYFTDNELNWGPNEDNSQSLLNQYLELPAGSPGLAVAEQYPNDPNGFVTALATRYFSVTSAAIDMYDSHHLNLGVKAESNDIPPELLEVASHYVDAFSIDDYQLQPGDAAAAVEAFPHYLPVEANFANFEALVHKPIIIAEYSFRATGPDTPNTVPSILATFPTQQARAAAYTNYIGTMYQSAPWVVGDDWFEYVDEPKGGRFDGENSNFGLVSVGDVPYAPMVQATTLLHTATPDKAISSGPECDSWTASGGGATCASVMPHIDEPLTIVTNSLSTADVQLPYSAAVIVAGGKPAYAFAVSQGQLPTGLNLNAQTGVISGTPLVLGTFNVTVQATDSSGVPTMTSAPLSLTVIQTELSDPMPTVTSVSPALGVGAGGGTITINGTGFTQGLAGPTFVQFGTKAATNVVVNAAGTQLTATIPAAVASGTVNVSVSTPGGSTGPAGQYTYIFSQPSVSAVAPADGPPGGGTVVTITGNAFNGATSVRFAGTAATFAVNSNSSITATSPPGTGGSEADITVTGPGGTSGVNGTDLFTYGPLVSGVSPNTGTRLGGTTVTIRGAGFSGATTVAFGAVPAQRFTVNSSTLITAVSPPGNVATAAVTVTTPGGTSPQTAFDTFSYIAVPPSVTGLSPAVGPPGGGTTVFITGGSFTGATTVSFGTNPATSFSVNSATSITATAPAGAAKAVVGVTVTGPGGTSSATSSDNFTYGPVVTSVSPNIGSHLGRTTVTIKGAGFGGATAVNFGTTAVTSGFTVNGTGTQITVAAPAGVAGTVDITVTVGAVKTTTSVVDQYTYV